MIGNAAGERFAVGSCDGCLLYSRDRGAHWDLRTTNVTSPLRGLHFVDSELFSLGDSGALYRLDASRTTWQRAPIPTNVGPTAAWTDAHDRYLVGYGGTILHRPR